MREEAVPFALVFDGADVLVAQRVAVFVDEFDDVVAVLVIVVLFLEAHCRFLLFSP